MAVQILLQPEHGYILVLAVLTVFVNVWAMLRVGSARKKYKIFYPQMYAEESDKNAKAFNCVQRAHQNMLENLPVFFVMLFTSAIFRPGLAAIVGLVRVVAFIVYVREYSTGDPKKRHRAEFGHVAALVEAGMTIEAALKILGLL